ncbi:MAG: cell division protein FtsZ [Bacteroidales bacterium]|nr:cell division protein FtsZ [Bacteroidales bacterium]
MAEDYITNPNAQNELFKPVDVEKPNYIKVIGVGGGGGNAVNHMMEEGIQGVDFVLCNTDHQALLKSRVKTTVHLGKRELGAGNDPNIGREAAEMSRDELEALMDDDTKMLFVTAGMGGGTGTGAAPVVAKMAKDKGILTVGIVTMPMEREGRRRKLQALAGIDELKKCVDTLILISTDKLRDQYGNMKLSEAFKKADDVLATAARGIAEIITVPGYVNVDFEDVKTVMKDSGKAIMGSGVAEGENRAEKAIKDAIHSPLLNDSNIEGAKNILLYITSGTNEVSLDEVDEILEIAQNACGNNSDVIWGNGTDESLGEALSVTLIATGFNHDAKPYSAVLAEKQNPVNSVNPVQPKKVYDLSGKVKGETTETPEAPEQSRKVEGSAQPANLAVGSVAATEVEKVFPKEEQPIEKHEEKTVHSLFTPVTEVPEPVEGPTNTIKPIEPKVVEPVETPTPTVEDNQPDDDTPLFEPTIEPTPAPVQETPRTVHYEEEKPVVRVFDNPFRSSGTNDDDGFEITSRIITQEEVQAKAEQEIAVLEAKKAKQADPKEQLKKQRLRALSMNFRTARGLEELENQPAYLRRNVEINQADEELSDYSASQNGISGENSYLHKNVD